MTFMYSNNDHDSKINIGPYSRGNNKIKSKKKT